LIFFIFIKQSQIICFPLTGKDLNILYYDFYEVNRVKIFMQKNNKIF